MSKSRRSAASDTTLSRRRVNEPASHQKGFVMFRKAHLYFTMLFTGVTSAIMILMSLLYLHVSENNLRRNHFDSFCSDAGTIITALEQSSTISMQWLSRLEAQGGFAIYIIDNGVPFLHNKLPGSSAYDDYDSQTLIAESLDVRNRSDVRIQVETVAADAYYGISHNEYEFISPSLGASFYCSLIEMEKNTAKTQIIILSPTGSLREQITRQRIHFVLINLAAICALTVFAWFFTGKLLKPLRENQLKQAQFIAAASHELRTPLSVILASDECCQSATEDERRSFHNTIQTEGKRMKNLINDMLTLAHSDLNRFPHRPVLTEPDTLCMHAYEAFEPLAREKGIAMHIALPEAPLPRCMLDPDRIMQVLSILLHNALSYTKEGGRINLELKCSSRLSIYVSDTGVGIPDADKKRIFDRFYRVEKSRSTKGHFGLGLSIAYEIVSAHHGRISVHDNPDGGSIFIVELPISSKPNTAPQTAGHKI